MSFKPITIPDAPYGADVAADTPELHNDKNALLRQAVSITGGSGILVQNTAAGIRLRARRGTSIATLVKFVTPTGFTSLYFGNIMDLTGPAGIPPDGYTVGSGCYICVLNEIPLSSGQTPSRPGAYARGPITNPAYTGPDDSLPALPLVEVDSPARGGCS